MPETPAVDAANAVFQSIPVDQIKPSRHQARKQFDEADIKGLADSIANEGLQNPVTIRKVEGGYELISGERRLRAMKLLGKLTIDAHIVDVPSEASAAAKGMVENLQRKDLNPIEEAEGFQELNRLDPNHWTQDKIAEVIGKDKSYVSRSFDLLELPEAIKDQLRRHNLERNHGIELLRLNNANSSKAMAHKAIKGGWSVKKTREAIDKKTGKQQLKAQSEGRIAGSSSLSALSSSLPLSDPFSDLWKPLLADTSVSACSYWTVEFTKDDWCFKASRTKFAEPKDFADWFRQLADAMAKTQAP